MGSPSSSWGSPRPEQGSRPCGRPGSASPVPTDGLEEDEQAPAEDFPGLQAEVSAWARGLEGLSGPLCEQLLTGLRQVLRDKPALETLEESVSSPWGGGSGGGVCPGRRAHLPPCARSWSRA